MLIGREEFISIIDALEKQYEYDNKYLTSIEALLGVSGIPSYNNHEVCNVLFKLLQKQFPPNSAGDCEIERYCYELNFGYGENGVRIKTPGMLYDSLVLKLSLDFCSKGDLLPLNTGDEKKEKEENSRTG